MKKIALFGPGTVIYPVEEEILDGFCKGEKARAQVTVVDCNGLDAAGVLNRLKSPTLLGGPRVVVLRDFFKADLRDAASLCHFLENDGRKRTPSLVIIEDESPPSKKEKAPFLSLIHEIRDLSFHGLSRAERIKKARQMIQEFLDGAGKTITRDALELFLKSVELQDPSSVRTEVEKLVTAIGGRSRITVEDVTGVVVSSRQDEVYLLTDALGRCELQQALEVVKNLLAHRVHPLALLQVINTWLLRLYTLKQVFSKPAPDPGRMDFGGFKAGALPRIEEQLGRPLPWPLSGLKPYAIFSLWKASLNFNQQKIAWAIREMTTLDLQLKGGGMDERMVIEMFLVDLVN